MRSQLYIIDDKEPKCTKKENFLKSRGLDIYLSDSLDPLQSEIILRPFSGQLLEYTAARIDLINPVSISFGVPGYISFII